MSLADEARDNAIHCEMVKYAYRQSKDGVVVSFVVHPNDIPAALSTSHIGARYVAVLVQVGDDERPIPLKAKEKAKPDAVSPSPRRLDKPAGAKWQDMKPQQQAGMRCQEPIFWAYLNEEHGYHVTNKDEAAEAVREKCVVKSRKMLDDPKHHASRTIWHQLDSGYQAWKALEHA